MSIFGDGILGSLGGLFGYGGAAGMANSHNQFCGFGQQQAGMQNAYYEQLLRAQMQQQQYQQNATPKPKVDDNIIDAEFTVVEIDGRKLIGEDK